MTTRRRPFYDDPQQFLDDLTTGLLGVERWAAYPEREHWDNSLRHAFQIAFLAKAMLELERAHGDARDLDGERILAAATLPLHETARMLEVGPMLVGPIFYISCSSGFRHFRRSSKMTK